MSFDPPGRVCEPIACLANASARRARHCPAIRLASKKGSDPNGRKRPEGCFARLGSDPFFAICYSRNSAQASGAENLLPISLYISEKILVALRLDHCCYPFTGLENRPA